MFFVLIDKGTTYDPKGITADSLPIKGAGKIVGRETYTEESAEHASLA